ncbi:MAG: thymidine kinase [Candidatus Cloacimonetes bacterium]|nr:thymidine kinase [Candidatus Cloacimonadota bacterium]MBT6993909.1 thymidine kinase [Candidatus Cloacimonadota bacterium]MBT7468948.1 thymidine kinase [Candidatus Cloacimonadota bacterium]
MNIINNRTGWIEVVCGSMFSGKTEELIRRIHRAEYARQKIQVFKPKIDNRYEKDQIVSHNKMKTPSEIVVTSDDIHNLVKYDTEVVAIDEVQFFDDDIVKLCNNLADSGKRVIVAGLDQDFTGKPFGPIPKLLAIAEYISKLSAICVICGNPASRTQRVTKNKETVLVGTTDIYEARCRNCHEVL